MGNIRILICDDHSYIRDGIIKRLENHPGMFIVGEASDGSDMIAQYEILKPDLVISDIEMPPLSGIDALKKLRLKYPDIKVLFISVYQGEDTIFSIIKAGGLGLISKGSDKGELLYAINEVINGRQYFGPLYTNKQIAAIINKFDTPPKDFNIDPRKVPTEIEHKILVLIDEGLKNNEIADKLSLGARTIESHRSDMIKKFNLKDGHALLSFAIRYIASKEITKKYP